MSETACSITCILALFAAALSLAKSTFGTLWPQRRCLRRLIGHRAAVNGISVTHDGEGAVSCGADCTVRLWKVPYAAFESGPVETDEDPVVVFRGKVRRSSRDPRPEMGTFGTVLGIAARVAGSYRAARRFAQSPFQKIDHHWRDARFATAAAQVDIWDHERAEPVQSFTWGSDTITSVRFNPAEAQVI